MIPRRVWQAVLIALICHGLFILTARYRLSYDAYTHMLFANHYAENWFSLWEPRWYTGFTVVSYPPLTHQLVALFTPLLGFDRAFALVLWLVVTLYPLGVYSFSRIFIGKTASAYAALASAILLPIYVTAYVFGQFPFLTSTLFALFSAASLNRCLREGGAHNFILTVSLYTTTMASHHATLIVQPFLILAVLARNVVQISDVTYILRVAARFILVGTLSVLFSILVIWPFWQWGTYQTMQTPIDHLSRHNFITDPLAFAIFFFPLYGPLIIVMPFLIRRWHPRFWGLLFSFTILLILGLGGTTPLPRLLFGTGWEWLTYDRFAFWASLTLTPFFGILFIGLRKRLRFTSQPILSLSRRFFFSALILSIFAATSLGSWFQPLIFPTQPAPVDMQPIVKFLNQADHSQWRYMTFGFGNQFVYLNLLTKATTLDGSYNTVRTIPELRESGIAEVDTSYWTVKGVPAIEAILKKSGEHGVRWGFVNREEFISQLEKDGWVYQKTLSNKVQVWENPSAILPLPSQQPETPPITSFSWGVFPLLALVTTLALAGTRIYPIQGERALRNLYSITIALIPVSLCFWIFRTIAASPPGRVYFIYTDALFFVSDGLALFALILWASVKISQQSTSPIRIYELSNPYLILFFIFILSSISILWSRAWQTSLYISLHFWLIFLLILSLREWHTAWKFAIFGLCTALGIQIITGFIEYALQSTAFLKINMNWPGVIDPSMRGVSVVQLANGLRILRTYGTLPHPNILGGFALFALLGPISLFLTNKKPNYPALIMVSLGIILIALTFSRSAWLGVIVFFSIVILKSKYFDRQRLLLLISTSALTIALTFYPLRELIFTRISNAPVATEQLSSFGRTWLTEQAVGMFRAHPLTGVGIGSFIIELSTYAVEGALIEPVHNIFLLAGSELGIFGLLLMIGLFLSIGFNIFKTQTPQAILASAAIAGLGVISLFDHYLWTLAPGRTLLALALGLWIGQLKHDA